MAANLEVLLKAECKEQGMRLYRKLERIKCSAEAIWEEPRLLWFTDHGMSHSKRIIELLSQILENLQTTTQRLSAQELYILLAACYLHDIGMQDFEIDGRSMDDFKVQDYELIRRRHPQRSKTLILQRSIRRQQGQFQIDMDDDEPGFLALVADVCQGHGSEFFEITVQNLRNTPYHPDGQTIRGDLLTALLMIADELDLRESRARIPKEMSLSAISTLHNYVQHYVSQVEIFAGKTSKEREVTLTFNYPGNGHNYFNHIRHWVADKLQKQLRRTEDIVIQATNGELRWAPKLRVHQKFDVDNIVRPLPENAQAELVRQLSKAEIVDCKQVLQALSDLTSGGSSPGVVCIVADDEEVAIPIIRWLNSQCDLRKMKFLHWNLRHEPYGARDLLVMLQEALLPPPPGKTPQRQNLERDMRLFIEDLSDSNYCQPTVVLYQHFDTVDSYTIERIAKNLIESVGATKLPLQFVLTCKQFPEWSIGKPNAWQIFNLSNFDKQHITDHLHTVYGFPLETAASKADEIYGVSSNGKPEGVYHAFYCLSSQNVDLGQAEITHTLSLQGYINCMPPDILRAAKICAIPHRFTSALGLALIQTFVDTSGGSPQQVFAGLLNQPFVYQHQDEWEYTSNFRSHFTEELARDETLFEQINAFLVDFFEQEQKKAAIGQEQQLSNSVFGPEGPLSLDMRRIQWRIPYHQAPIDSLGAARNLVSICHWAADSLTRTADFNLVKEVWSHQQRFLSNCRVEELYIDALYSYLKDDLDVAEEKLNSVWGQETESLLIKANAGHLLAVIRRQKGQKAFLDDAEVTLRTCLDLCEGMTLRDRDVKALTSRILNSLAATLIQKAVPDESPQLSSKQVLDEAERLLRRALQIEKELEAPFSKAHALNTLGTLLTKERRYDEAETVLNEALDLSLKSSNLKNITYIRASLADLQIQLGQPEDLQKAAYNIEECLNYAPRARDAFHQQGLLWNKKGLLLMKIGNPEQLGETAQCFRHSLEFWEKKRNPQGQHEALVHLAELMETTGDHVLAKKYQQRAMTIDLEGTL